MPFRQIVDPLDKMASDEMVLDEMSCTREDCQILNYLAKYGNIRDETLNRIQSE